jgi:RNA polymerase sigma factor, sigma-70 family
MSDANVYYSSDIKYAETSDEDLIDIIKSGNKYALEHLINRYKSLVNMKVSKYYIIGAEREDIVQEGLIGLFKAIKNYQINKQSSFKNFANMCIERQLITAIKSSNRQKHMPLNSYLSLNMNAYDNNDINDKNEADLIEILNTNLIEDPLDTITQKEYYKIIENAIDKSLSSFEKQVLNFYVQGQSYGQIAEKLNTPVKSVDNAIQRIRKKATKEIPNEQF